MALSNDFFGLEMIGYDPYHQAGLDRLSRLQQLDSIISGSQTRQAGSSSTASATENRMAAPSTLDIRGGGDMASFLSERGSGGLYSPHARAPGEGDDRDPREPPPSAPDPPPAAPPPDKRCPSPFKWYDSIQDCALCEPNVEVWDASRGCVPSGGGGNQPPPPPPGGGGGDRGGGGTGGTEDGRRQREDPPDRGAMSGGPYTDSTIPKDIQGLRNALAQFLQANYSNGLPAYPGNTNINLSGMGDARYSAGESRSIADQFGAVSGNIARGMENFNPVSSLEALYPSLNAVMGGQVNQQGLPFLAVAQGPYEEMLRTGGMQNIAPALAAIEKRGLGLIEDLSAQTREQYGALGLGAGSDVNEALARGQSRGVADIIAQQSQLTSQVMGEAQNRRLAAAGMAPELAASVQNPYDMALQRIIQGLPIASDIYQSPADQMRQNAALRSSSLSGISSASQAASQPWLQEAQLIAQLMGLDAQVQGQNIGRSIEQYNRQTTPYYLDYAVPLATGFPPIANKPTVQGSSGGMGILGSIIGGLFGLM